MAEFDQNEQPPFGELTSEGLDPELEELKGSDSDHDRLDPGESITAIYQFEMPSHNQETYEYTGGFS